MPRAQSAETALRDARSLIKKMSARITQIGDERDRARIELRTSEMLVREWQGRFDQLLERLPKVVT